MQLVQLDPQDPPELLAQPDPTEPLVHLDPMDPLEPLDRLGLKVSLVLMALLDQVVLLEQLV